ncbi:hypothetical protein GCM10027591_04990 [Zhihengliuella somnathii]
MNRILVSALKVVLILIAATAFAAQIFLPYAAGMIGGPYVEVRHLVTAYSVAGILSLLCFQIALLAVWRLLAVASRGRMLAARALRWVNILILAVAGSAVIPALTLVHLLFIVGVGGPGVFLWLVFCLVCGIALVLLLMVMKSLLAVAVERRSGLDEVV